MVDKSKDCELEYLHMFDSRWTPGMIDDSELDNYVNKCVTEFQDTIKTFQSHIDINSLD
jgi:hypothetical protein